MAKRGARRRSGYRYLPIDHEHDITAPASNAIVKGDLSSVVDSDVWAMSMKCTWALEAHTAGEGPITVGVAHGDYANSEIKEALEAQASWDSGDKVATEQAKRKVRTVGKFSGALATEVLNDGRMIKTKLGFVLEIGETLSIWAWNKDTNQLTTGTLLQVEGGLSCRKR